MPALVTLLETDEAERRRAAGQLPISALGRYLGGFGNVDELPAEEPLASISRPEHDRRSRLAEDGNRYLSVYSERAKPLTQPLVTTCTAVDSPAGRAEFMMEDAR